MQLLGPYKSCYTFKGYTHRWIGISNPDQATCNSVSSCAGKSIWMDKTVLVGADWYAILLLIFVNICSELWAISLAD